MCPDSSAERLSETIVAATRSASPLRRGRGRGRRARRCERGASHGPLRGDHGPVGLGQVDADAHPRGSRPADLGHASRSTASSSTELDDTRADAAAPRPIGFIFQTFNLLPVLNAEENILLPLSIAGRKPDQRVVRSAGRHGRHPRPPEPPPGRDLRRPAAARGGRARAGLAPGGRVRRRADRQPRLQASGDVLELLRQAVDEFDQTVVMVTHDAHAASFADRLLVLADGRIVHDREAATASRRST